MHASAVRTHNRTMVQATPSTLTCYLLIAKVHGTRILSARDLQRLFPTLTCPLPIPAWNASSLRMSSLLGQVVPLSYNTSSRQ